MREEKRSTHRTQTIFAKIDWGKSLPQLGNDIAQPRPMRLASRLFIELGPNLLEPVKGQYIIARRQLRSLPIGGKYF